jgi:hypothetical protein
MKQRKKNTPWDGRDGPPCPARAPRTTRWPEAASHR